MAPCSAAAGKFFVAVRWSVVDHRRGPRPFGFLRPLRAARSWYTRADLPTLHLVVSGLYRYLRNPMYVAVVSLILGQGLFFGSVRVLEYGIAVWVGFYLFVLIYEEPTLRKSYGPEYEEFCASVPRWIPHLRPWRRNRE